jgi:polysaccharide export outer membrane protein
VGARGNIVLPLIGPVAVKGLSVLEAERKIECMYRRDYVQDPHVTLFVKEQVGSRVTLVGAVNKPGTIDYTSRQTLLQVLAMSGGLSEKAGKTVQVRRVVDDPTQPYTFLIDLEEIVKGGNMQANIEIRGGDVIYVPDAGTVYVDGAVRKPGTYPVRQSMTLQEAITAAGGFSATAEQNDIKLIRSVENGKREVVQISLQDLRQEGAHSLLVKDRDVIFVETNLPNTLLYGLRLNLGYGLVGFGYTPPNMSPPLY